MGLVCARSRGQELEKLNFDRQAAYCGNKVKKSTKVCFDPKIVYSPGYDLPYLYYAVIEPLGMFTAKGKAVVSIEPSGVTYYGNVNGLEANLVAAECTATNGCGVHIHGGSSCTNTTTQGPHLWLPANSTDPWLVEKYSSDAMGMSNLSNLIKFGTNNIEGKPFICK